MNSSLYSGTGKSATKTAKELGIDVNTVCRWVRDYRKAHNMLSYAKEQGISGSMSRPACPYDNACVESFFATLKKEQIYKRKYDTM